MTDNTILESLRKFLEETVACKIKLQKPTSEVNNYELVNPSVHVGWIPPKIPENMQYESQTQDTPCILVGLDDSQDDGNEANIGIRLSLVTYNGGTFKRNLFYPDFNGYKDLLNLMTLCRFELSKVNIIDGIMSLQRPFQWGMYQDQPYPYWYGWLTFKVSCIVMERIPNIEEQYK